ncbi:hypothetical protein SEUCBS140593_005495 [Sporothrix eucalyptigena]|uniref:Uncharacterized protein n=1 Tax=Sporothrix eucalyptigena TaxID=1812306 RepID=A0ABP0BZ30_9PEZI
MSSIDARAPSPADSDSDVPVAQQQQNADAALDTFISAHHLPADGNDTSTPPRLQAPVVIPQRRPGNKERGFVKAYAPDLAAHGIDEAPFLEFIGATNKAAQASKWLHAIQVAAMGTGFIPNHIALGVSAAVQIIAGIVAKAETRWKTNTFMDRINDEFFRPRGLYCLIMSYNPIAMGEMAKPDPAQALSSHEHISTTDAGPLSTAKRNLRSPTAGVSHGEESLPNTVATLVYPDTSKEKSTSKSSQEAKKKKKAFVRLNNYFDRRAQARYATESNGDILSVPQTKPFPNRYLDPNHPASNGGLLGLISGGKLTPNVEKQKETMRSAKATQEQAIRDQQAAQMANLNQVLQGMGLTPEQQQDYIRQYESAYELQLQQFQQQSELLEQSHRRINRNILYLLIVNMPTEAELEAARNGEQPSTGIGQIEINQVEVTD